MSLPSALIADDEPLLRERLRVHLARLWPELQVVAEARNGREAIELFETHRPKVAFLDVHMPGLNGIDAARSIARRAEIVFVTAHEHYAVQAFEHGAIDYVVKPFEEARLADSVARLKARMAEPRPPASGFDAVLDRLAAELKLRGGERPKYLQWIRASVATSVRLIPVEQIAFLRSDEKYTLIAWRGDAGKPGEALIRTPLKELLAQLDATQFAQVHRSVVVNLRAISHVIRGLNETADIHLKGRGEVLPVSRSFLHLFKQM